jgi:hypothetical protein
MQENLGDYETSRSRVSRSELGLSARDVVVLAATIFVAAVMPLDVVFGSPDAVWITAASLFTAVLFAGDVATRFSRPIVVGGRPVEDRAVIRRHYLRTWFVVDVLAAIPFDVIAVAPGIAGGSTAQVLRLLSLLRVGLAGSNIVQSGVTAPGVLLLLDRHDLPLDRLRVDRARWSRNRTPGAAPLPAGPLLDDHDPDHGGIR